MPSILDVAIGTIFVFLLFSLVVSALNEWALSLMDQRAKFLRLGLAEIFGKVAGGLNGNKNYQALDAMGEKLLGHGLINAFSRSDNGGTSPSYIPAGAFVTALLDQVVSLVPTAANDPKQLAVANTFLANLQAKRPPVGTTLSFVDFDQVVSGFITDYASLAPSPVAASPLAQLKESVSEAQLRARAQNELVTATTGTAGTIIAKAAYAAFKTELNDILTKASNDAALQQAIAGWLSLADRRSGLEAAAASTMVSLLKDSAEHTGAAIQAGIKAITGNTRLQESLLSLFRSVNGDVKQFKVAVEGWFNGVMDRVSGWYKRYAQNAMILIGIILAAILNVDTIRIVRELSKNPNLTKAITAQAEVITKSHPTPQTWDQTKADIEKKLAPEQKALDDAKAAETAATEAVTKKPDAAPQDAKKAEEDAERAKTALARAQATREIAQRTLDTRKEQLVAEAGSATEREFYQSVSNLKNTGIPLGWDDKGLRDQLGLSKIDEAAAPLRGGDWFWYNLGAYPHNFFTNFPLFLPLIGGWLLTAIAGSLGAPFWFDLLGRFVNVRAAGRPPGEKEATSIPSRPPPASLDTTPGTHAPSK